MFVSVTVSSRRRVQLREIRFAQSLFNDVFCRCDARHV